MSQPPIVVEKLSKLYRIGMGYEKVEPAASLIGRMAQVSAGPFRYARSKLRAPREDELLWALKDVSFEVQKGEFLGIVGHNGSGKSTLLKILSRITEPTSGWAELRGRVGSMLEVGTGFHPELTGRENVYMNGAILGLKSREIDLLFDRIVEFAGSRVARMIDTPVKRYSSGMYVRLAFAVAAHLEPEVLLIDEVLAVGDAEFIQRSYRKLKEASSEGQTILFVSHLMGSITELAHRVVWMEHGRIREIGPPAETVRNYLETMLAPPRVSEGPTDLGQTDQRLGRGRFRFRSVTVLDRHENAVQEVHLGGSLDIVLEYVCRDEEPLSRVAFSVGFRDPDGQVLTCCWTKHRGQDFAKLPAEGSVRCTIGKLALAPGRYTLEVRGSCYEPESELPDVLQDEVLSAGELTVLTADYYRTGTGFMGSLGRYVCEHSWSQSATDSH
ncbi:MAG: ABC transporter ATP-binding protein [Planctomycetes bacterium]|nr:ABC transporter ATP-binding protein [Planctomycetota bacterium]